MPAQNTSPREAVLLDTDIGTDIDDAVCLAYLLRQPRCELLGVTTVSGPVKQRAALASAVCRAADRGEVPVRAGQSNGILIDEVQPRCPQEAVLPRFDHAAPESFAPNAAVNFLREQIRARPNEVTLLAIGPMTNLALLFTLDPEIPKLLKRLVLMCGRFTTRTPGAKAAEWNALCDPIATAAVYRAPATVHRSIGLDVTIRCRMPADECVAKFAQIGGPLAVVAAMTEVWAHKAEQVTFHDPLAAAVIFEPGLCEWQAGQVDVELKSDRAAGMTHFTSPPEAKPHEIAVDVNPAAFFEHYFDTVAGK